MAALVAFAVLVDLKGSETELAPFAGDDVPAGALLTDSVVDWREVPRGLLPPASLEGKVTAHAIGRGEPITQTALTDHQPPPDGWWSVELPLPDNASPGRAARVVVSDPPMATDGLVVSIARSGAFDRGTSGLVSIPADAADAVARAAARGNVVVLLAP